MKPTSIIFLIVSVVLVISGLITVGVANRLAASEGIVLTDKVSEGEEGYVFTYDYGSDNIGKISVNVKDAEINIIGGADRAYIELVNFPDGMYEFSSTNRVLTVNNSSDMSDISALASLVTSFKGLRGFVNYYNMRSLPKTVNIYISANHPVKNLDCTLGVGNVTIENSKSESDYNINIGTGELTVSEVTTPSSVNAVIGTGNLLLESCDIGKLTAKLETGSVNADAAIDRIDADIGTGDFNYKYRSTIEYTNLSLFSNVGRISLDGEMHGGYYARDDVDTDNILAINIGIGDIVISSVVGS